MLHRTASEASAAALGPVELCADPDPGHPDWRGQIPPGLDLPPRARATLVSAWRARHRQAIDDGEHDPDRHRLCPTSTAPASPRPRLRSSGMTRSSHPARDGGYVLLGLRRFDPSLFEGIAWSTSAVAAATIAEDRSTRLVAEGRRNTA